LARSIDPNACVVFAEQVTIAFWPALLLYNGLPVPLMYRLGVRSPTSEDDGPLNANAVSVPPGVQAPVNSAMDGRELFSLQISTSMESQSADNGDYPISDGITRRLSVASSSDGSIDTALITGVQGGTASVVPPLGRQRSGWGWAGWGEEGGVVAGADGWTVPINVIKRSGGLSSRTSPRGTLSIPAAGYKIPVRLLHHGAPLDCVLMAESTSSTETAVRTATSLG
jgi:hypothetical protein